MNIVLYIGDWKAEANGRVLFTSSVTPIKSRGLFQLWYEIEGRVSRYLVIYYPRTNKLPKLGTQ